MTYTEALRLIAFALVMLSLLFCQRQLTTLRRQLQRERRNRAKERINDHAKLEWAALMAGRCPYCCGSGIQLTREIDPDDSFEDEPEWDVSDCHACSGSGVIDPVH